MPDLGKYAEAVLSSYVLSILLIVAMIVVSVRRSRKVQAALEEIEKRGKSNG